MLSKGSNIFESLQLLERVIGDEKHVTEFHRCAFCELIWLIGENGTHLARRGECFLQGYRMLTSESLDLGELVTTWGVAFCGNNIFGAGALKMATNMKVAGMDGGRENGVGNAFDVTLKLFLNLLG